MMMTNCVSTAQFQIKRNAHCLIWAFLFGIIATFGGANPALSDENWKVHSTIADERIVELSGLAESIRYPGHFWAINDSGDPLRAFLISPEGKTTAVVRLRDYENIDTESVRVVGTPEKSWVYIGDIGDNTSHRSHVAINRFVEPELDINLLEQDISVPCQQMVLRYGDGKSTDAETLLVDNEGYVAIVTKSLFGSKLWIADKPFAEISQTLRLGAEIPLKQWKKEREHFSMLFTDGAISNDGKRLVLMTYTHFFVWNINNIGVRDLGKVLLRTPDKRGILPVILIQPEGITFVGKKRRLAVSGEWEHQPIMISKRGY